MDTGNAAKAKGALRTGRWFRGLDEALQDELLAMANIRTLAPGQRLFSRGDPPSGLFGMLEGRVRITATGDNGKEALLTVAEPPSWFGEIAVFDGLPRTHDAIAESDARVVQVPQAALDAMLDAKPRYWRDLGLLIASKLRLAFVAMEDTALLPVPERVARRLVFMAEGYGDRHEHGRRVVAVRQEQLAAMVSISRQTANQVLKDLEARGLVRVSYGQIEILDLAGLRKAAGER